MPLELSLTATTDPTNVVAHLDRPDQPLAPPTPLAGLSRIEGEANPFVINPFDPGQALFEAMGGSALLTRLKQLEQTGDPLLLLITDAQTAALPWEYAVLPDGDLLGRRFGLLRLLPEAPPARPAPAGPLNLAVLAADPLVDPKGSLSRLTAALVRPPPPVKPPPG
jgi:hypothetical protein